MPDSGENTVTEYRLRAPNGAVTPRSDRPREDQSGTAGCYGGRTAREQIELMASIEREYRGDPAAVTIQVSHDGGESWELFEETSAPDRSVSVVVDEMVEKVRLARYGDRPSDTEEDRRLQREQVRKFADWFAVPAMVEALSGLLRAVGPYVEGAAPGEQLNGLWAQRFVALSEARVSAGAVLGGEVQGPSRDELQRAVDAAYAAMNSSQYVGGPSEREAWRTATEELSAVVTQRQGTDRPASTSIDKGDE